MDRTSIEETYPHPQSVFYGFENETEFVEWLCETFERFGWNTYTEVHSRNRNSRADLIVDHPEWATIGVECKMGHRARKIATAVRQVDRYRGENFAVFDIDAWAIAAAPTPLRMQPPYTYSGDEKELADDYYHRKSRLNNRFYHEFLNTLDIGWLVLQGRMEFVFNNSNPMVKVPIANVQYPSGELETPAIERLNDSHETTPPEYYG